MRKKCDHSNFDLGQGTIGIVGIGKGVGNGKVGSGKVGSGNPVTVGRGRVGKRVGRRVVNGDGVADGANVGCMVEVGVAIITSVL